MRGFSTPLNELYSAELGTVEDVLSGVCDDHTDLLIRFVGHCEDEGFGADCLSIIKHPGDSYLQLMREDTIYPPFELLYESPTGTFDKLHSKNVGLTSHTVPEPRSNCGRGEVLHQHWIRIDKIRDWYRVCKHDHLEVCSSPSFARGLDARPAILIDCQDGCLVPGSAGDEYLALSYVWGHVESLRLSGENAELLRLPGSLRDQDMIERIPTTILHAMELTRLLGARHLWIDSLCIAQDEEDGRKQEQLNDMAAIYANASLTIVAADGSHADYGLRGIRELSRSVNRNLHQEVVPFGPHRSVVERTFSSPDDPNGSDPLSLYYQRSWTYQEYLFSKRRLVFQRNSILWECCSTTWYEDVRHYDGESTPKKSVSSRRRDRMFGNALPDLYDLFCLVNEFNQTQVTYEGDHLAAFAGIASALSLSFEGGLLCGLTELFFDIALPWQPLGDLRRRKYNPEDTPSTKQPCIPSWSWAGWAGVIDSWSWQWGSPVKRTTMAALTTREILPITTWRVVEVDSSTERSVTQREIGGALYDSRERYRDPDCSLEEGWTRHTSPGIPPGNTSWNYPDHSPPEGFGSHFYTHVSHPVQQFWYPVPLPASGARPTTRSPATLLCTTAETAVFYTRGMFLHAHVQSVSIEDKYGYWAGVLRPHYRGDISEDVRPRMQPLELVAISRGTAKNSEPKEQAMEEWHLAERPKVGRLYEYYNVLWVLRRGRYSYRRGIGRVPKDVWEQQSLDKVQLLLA
ncbi:hypothetical protein LTR17_022693 [Elasticomyces elasticus]|nr:hypothetical protein LTR17_022693 [Elasticomyces elasticus]